MGMTQIAKEHGINIPPGIMQKMYAQQLLVPVIVASALKQYRCMHRLT